MDITNKTTKAQLIEYVKELESFRNQLIDENVTLTNKINEIENTQTDKTTLNNLISDINAKLMDLEETKRIIDTKSYKRFSRKSKGEKLVDSVTLHQTKLAIIYLTNLKNGLENLINKVC